MTNVEVSEMIDDQEGSRGETHGELRGRARCKANTFVGKSFPVRLGQDHRLRSQAGEHEGLVYKGNLSEKADSGSEHGDKQRWLTRR
jgi:hypothetical protein